MGRKTHLKLRFVQEYPMSKQGYKEWSPKLRAKIHKKVYRPVLYIRIPVEEIRNKEAIGKFVSENLWTGTFFMFGYSRGKTRTHVKLVCLARLDLRIDEDGKYSCRVTRNWRLSRYWFYEK